MRHFPSLAGQSPLTRVLPFIFLCCALPTGLGLVALTPMSQAPDEPAHIARAEGLLHGQILGHEVAEPWPSLGHGVCNMAGVMTNQSIINAAMTGFTASDALNPAAASARRQLPQIQWADHQVLTITQMAEYFPAFYIPAALGIALGHLFGLVPLYALFLGRLMMLGSFCAMGFAALRLARFGQPVLLATLLLPMTLYLAASFNLDAQLIAATVLACAILTRDDSAAPRLHWLALALLTLVICAKLAYGLLLFAAVPLTLPRLWRRFGTASLFALAPLLWAVLMARYSFLDWYRPGYHPGPLWPGPPGVTFYTTNPVENLRVLLAHPAQFVLLPVRSLAAGWPSLWHQAIGVAGWGFIMLPAWQYPAWAAALAAALLACLAQPAPRKFAPLDSGFILLLMAASFFAMSLALYLTWENVGVTLIDGLRGRYFLLLPPFLALALPGFGARLNILCNTPSASVIFPAALTTPVILLAAFDIFSLPSFVFHIFKLVLL